MDETGRKGYGIAIAHDVFVMSNESLAPAGGFFPGLNGDGPAPSFFKKVGQELDKIEIDA